MNSVKVTVLMTVYNGEAYIAQAVKSVLNQEYESFELLIINDGSTDNSIAIVESFNDARIRVIHNEINLGLVASKNKGIQAAFGDYIAMLDCDDIALPKRLLYQAKILDTYPEIGLVASQIYYINAEGVKTGKVKYKHRSEDIPAELFFSNCIAHSTVMVRKSLLERETYRVECHIMEDFDLWVRLAKLTTILILPVPLVLYRLHSTNISILKANIKEKNERIVVYNQLAELGIKTSKEEFELHFKIAKYASLADKASVELCLSWLVKLFNANNTMHKYPLNSFRRVLIKRFIIICGNSGLGMWALTKFFQFPLINFGSLSMEDTAKLVIKSLIKWQGKKI